MRLMTYNIRHALGTDRRLDVGRIGSIIAAAAPDLVCLQEVDRGVARSQRLDLPALLAEHLGMTPVYGANLDLQGGEYGNLTLGRFPLLHGENQRLPGPGGDEPRGCLATAWDTPDGPLTILNTHLGLAPAERLEQASFILANWRETARLALLGDLNDTPGSATLTALTAVWRETFPTAWQGPAGTFSRRDGPVRIDYCLTTSDLAASEQAILHEGDAAVASDHWPYCLTLRPA